MTEQDARIIINRKLIEAGWKLEGHDRNVLTEQHCGAGFSDYLLLGRKGQNLGVLSAKDDNQGDVYLAKEQARGYALAMGCKYIFLANSEQLYFWDIDEGDARKIINIVSHFAWRILVLHIIIMLILTNTVISKYAEPKTIISEVMEIEETISEGLNRLQKKLI